MPPQQDAPVEVGDIPLFIDVAGPHGPDGHRPVKTVRLCKNIQTGIFRLDNGEWELTNRGRKLGFKPLTKLRRRANDEPEYLDDKCRSIAELHSRRCAERSADDQHEQAVLRARKLGMPIPDRKSADAVEAETKEAIGKARRRRAPQTEAAAED